MISNTIHTTHPIPLYVNFFNKIALGPNDTSHCVHYLTNSQAQPKPQLSWGEWLFFKLIQPPPHTPGKVYFSA